MSDISLVSNAEELGRLAAELMSFLVKKALQTQERFSIALSGGETPRMLYERLAQPPCKDALPWDRMHFFFCDERFVLPDSPDSNFGMVRSALFDKVSLPPANIHPVITESVSLEEAAADYEKTLKGFFPGAVLPRFDMVFLGLGEDGHVASLFRGSAAVNETERWVAPVINAPKPPVERVTLTLPVLNNARRVFFLVSGSPKKEVFKSIQANDATDYPAQMVQPPSGTCTWLVDREAFGL